MSAETKLPRSLQLVGITAVLVFSISALSTYSYIRAIVVQWRFITSLPQTWDNIYNIFALPVFYGLLTVASAATFLALWLAPRTSLVKASLAYLAFLLSALAWRIYIHIPSADSFGFRAVTTTLKVYLGIHVIYAAYLVGLANCVLPNYSLKRTAADRLR